MASDDKSECLFSIPKQECDLLDYVTVSDYCDLQCNNVLPECSTQPIDHRIYPTTNLFLWQKVQGSGIPNNDPPHVSEFDILGASLASSSSLGLYLWRRIKKY